MSGNKPTHFVAVLHDKSGQWYTVGAGWVNEKGNISIKLDPFVDLGRLGPDDRLMVVLDTKKRTKGKPAKGKQWDLDGADDFGDDDIPF